jgi:hypothetical protein
VLIDRLSPKIRTPNGDLTGSTRFNPSIHLAADRRTSGNLRFKGFFERCVV